MRTGILLGAVLLGAAALAVGACGDDAISDQLDGATDGGADAGPPPIPSPYGIDTRPLNPTCVAPKRPPNPSSLKWVRVWNNVSLSTPMHIAQIPGDSTRMFAVLRNGSVVSFPTTNPPNTPTTVLTIPKTVNTNGEGGFLGFAFHPKFAQNGQVYLSYTTNGGTTDMRSVVARMNSTDNGATFAAGTYVDVIPPFDQPFTNHDGGDAHFGKDGYLYLSFGDGGSGGDPLSHGQLTTLLFSKILRIDVDKPQNGKPYGIPVDNPFATSTTSEPALFAYGFRNPFRFSIDPDTNQVWVADVGQGKWEEVDKVQNGGNYGWRFREGKHCYNPGTGCPTNGLIDPVWEYDHTVGSAIIGGPIYRGKAIPSIIGKYVVGDNGSGRTWILTDQGDGTWKETEITDRGGGAGWSAFDVDNDGEVYGVSLYNGIYKLVPAAADPPSTFPDKLSKTGCVDPQNPKNPAPGLVPYEPISPLWSDGAEKGRWLAIPDGTQIKIGADGDFDFPNDTVLMKSFRLGGKLIESRLFVRHDDGGWAGYTYEWDDAETDATLLPANKTRTVGTATWYYPSRAECNRCHTSAAGGSLGPETLQLNSDFVYPATNRLSNQMRTLDHIGMFDKPLALPVEQLPTLLAPAGSGPVEDRARSYMHANCSFCHRPQGGGGGNIDLRFSTPFPSSNACGATPQAGDLGITGAKVVLPGDPAKSILVQRPKRTDSFRMPPLATRVVDPTGTAVLEQWVQGFATCPSPIVDAGGN
ncbi:hypothetical protein BH09MYX1_BH09MYX1_23710 [soil metagenome]